MAETYGANFEASDVLRMFPTFVWKAQVVPSVRQEIEGDVLAILHEMRRDAGAAGSRQRTCTIWTNFAAWSPASMTRPRASWISSKPETALSS